MPTTITCVDVDAGIALMIAISEALKDAIDLLRFLWQLDLHEQFSYSHVDGITEKSKFPHVASQYRKHELVVCLAEVARNDALIKVVRFDPFQVPTWGLALFALRQYESFSADVHGILMGRQAGIS